MRRKGFTLIELLAVVVILAMLSLIAIPIILNIIEKSKKSAFLDSVYGVMEAVKLQYVEGMLNGKTETKIYQYPFENLLVKGEKPKGGVIMIDEDGLLSLAVYNDQWCALKGSDNEKIELVPYKEGACTLSETEIKKPMIQITAPNKNYVNSQKVEIEIITGKQDMISSFTYQIDEQEKEVVNGTKTSLLLEVDGVHKVKVEVDYKDEKIVKEVEYKIDSISPVIEFEDITIESDIASIYDLLDGVSVTDNIDGVIDSSNIMIRGSLSSIPNEYEIIYQVSDSAGNVTTKKRIITVTESAGPILNFSNPGKGQWTKELNIIATATDTSSIKTFTYEVIKDEVSGGEQNGVIDGNSGSASISLNSNGIYQIRLKASDLYGNESRLDSGIYKIDVTEPKITSLYTTVQYSMKQGISKSISDLYNVTYGPSGGNVVCKNGNAIVTDLKNLSIGNHTITCTATSTVGFTKSIAIKVSIITSSIAVEEDSIKDSLEVYYSASNNSGNGHQNNPSNWYDLSGNGRHGTFQNTVWDGKALTFNGNNSAVLMPVLKFPTLSLQTSFKTGSNISGTQLILANVQNGGCELYIQDSKLGAACYIGGAYRMITTSNVIESNHQYNTALTYDGTNLLFYVDGTLSGTYTNASGISYHATTIWAVGANPSGSIVNGNYFSGEVYSTRIYSKSLTVSEIQQNNKIDKELYDFATLEVYYSVSDNTGSGYQSNPGNWYDLSGNERHGTFRNTVWNGKKLTFNGTNSAVLMPVLKFPTLSLQASIKTGSNITRTQTILANVENGGCSLFLRNSGLGTVCHIGGSYRYIETTSKILPNHSYNLAMTYDGVTMNFYVDGVLSGSYTNSSGITYNATTIWAVGANPSGSSVNMEYFGGDVYSIRIYSGVLSPDEIKQNSIDDQSLYGSLEEDSVFSGLEVYYSASKNSEVGHQSSPSNWYDLSGNNRHGTFRNTVWNENKLTFNGSNSAVLMPILKYPKLTLQATIKTGSDITKTQTILANVENGGCSLFLRNSGLGTVCHIGGSYRYIETASKILSNHSYNVALTYDGATMKFYVDGILIGNYANTSGISYNGSTIWAVGANPSGSTVNTEYFKGEAYSARIYSRALTIDEIKQNYVVDKELYVGSL